MLLEVSGMARSTFYYRLKSSQKTDKYNVIKQQIVHIHHINKARYGYRRITLALHEAGIQINHKTVRKLMAKLEIRCMVRRRKHIYYKGEVGKVSPNLLQRDFNAESPLCKLVTDVTEFLVLGQKIYLSPVLDLYNREIVAYSISTRPNLEMVNRMLDKLFVRLVQGTGVILHSDQGALYQSYAYQTRIKQKGIKQSMSRRGNCLDNAVIENFFGMLKSELLYLKTFTSVKQFIKELNAYMKYYNQDRMKIKLEGMSPVKYRQKYTNLNY